MLDAEGHAAGMCFMGPPPDQDEKNVNRCPRHPQISVSQLVFVRCGSLRYATPKKSERPSR